MSKKKKSIIILSVVLAAIIAAGACCLLFLGKKETNTVRFADVIPDAVLGEEYDFEPYFEKEEKTTYAMTAEYMGDDFEWHTLEVDGFKFTQNVLADVHVTITATKGSLTYKGETNVGVMTTPDDMDQWMVNIWGGEGIKKTLNYDETYFSVKDSRSSVKVDYMGTAVKGSAISVFPLTDWPNNERLSVQDWENAVLTFDVFNTSEKDMTFGFLIRHHELGINTNFGTNTQYVAKPNEWTKIAISLRSFGITQKPIFDADFELSDYIVVQMTYDGATEDESAYVFGLYADNIDIVDYDAEKFPDLDTTLNYEYKDFFTTDDALSVYWGDTKIDKDDFTSTDVVSTESVKSVKALYSKNGSSTTGMVHSFIGGNPTGWKPLDISNAVFTFDVKCDNADKKFIVRFESDYNVFSRDLEFDLNKKSGTGWTSEALSDGWYRITLKVADSQMTSPFVRPDFVRCMRFYFTNETASKGKESVVYLDNLHMTGHETTKHPLDEENPWDTKSPYTAAEANDMFSTDDALSIYIGETKIENVMVNAADISEYSKNSLLSFKVSLSKDGSPSTAMVHSFIGGNPTGWKPLDISKAVVSFDVKPSNIDEEFVLKFEADYGSYSKELRLKAGDGASGQGWKSEAIGNGWYRMTIDVAKADIDSDAVHADFVRCMRLFFTNESAEAGKESVVYLDNLSMTNYKTTPHKLNASDPWNTPSPYGSGNTGGGTDEPVKELPECEKDDLINLTSEQCTMSSVTIDTKIYSEDSVQSLRLVQDKATKENIQWAAVFIAELNDWKGVDISNNAICFDLKTENYANWFGVSIEHTEKGVSEGVYFTPTAGSSGYGYECVGLDSDWVRVYVYPDMLWSEYTNSVFKILFTLNKEGSDISKDSAANIDNLHFVSGNEDNDAITAYSKCDDGSLDVLAYDHVVHSADSLRSLKLGISANRGEVWGNADVYISELNDWKPVDLGGKTITMEIKPVNTANYFGMAVERSGQGMSDMIYIGLGDSDAQKGWECSALSDGWYRVQVDVDKAFNGYQDKVFKIRFLVTNSGMDDSQDTALYIDKFYLDADLSELEEAVLSEEGDYIYADKVKVDGVLDVVDEETSMTAPYSEKAMKMGIASGRGEVWGCADIVLTSLAEGKNITLAGKTITFDMKLNNALNSVGLSFNVPGIGFTDQIWISCDGNGTGWTSQAIGGGWYRVTLDMDTCFGNYASCVSELRYMISNSGQNQEAETAVYIDNLALGEIVVSPIDENKDAIHTNLINVNSMLNALEYTNAKVGTNSIQSLKLGISAGRGETWSCGDLVIAALNRWNAIDLSGKTIRFEIYAENMPYFALHIGDSVNGYSNAIWVGLDSSDNASGWKCESIGDGWYSVTVEVDKAFPSYKSKAYKLRFMVTNSGKDYSADMAMYVDNLDLGIPLSELMGKTIVSENDDAIKTNAQNVDNVLSTLTYDEQVVSTDSLRSLKLGINGGRGETWANADIFISELIGWKPVDLVGKTISFDVKPVNNTPYFGFAIERSDVGLAEMIYVGFDSYDTAKGWSCQKIGDGWYKAIIDLDKAFGGYQDRVFKLRVLISNSGQNQGSETAVYLDNLYLGAPISELTEGVRTEENDAINVYKENVDNMLSTFAYNTSNFALYSEHSLEFGINGGRGTIWANGDIQIAELNNWSGVNLNEKIVEFDVKPVNSGSSFGIASEQSGVGLSDHVWIGFNSADDTKGWSCRPTGAGWYHVTIDMDKAFPNHSTSVFKFRIMVHNSDADQSANTSVYLDNLKWN